MQTKLLNLFLLLLIVPMVFVSCDKEEEADKEQPDLTEKVDLKPEVPKRTVIVYTNPSSGSMEGDATQVFVPVGVDNSQTIVIGSASFYDWVEDVKERLAREKLQDANEGCVLTERIAMQSPEHLDFEGKYDLKCVEVNKEEPSHTDPSPLDDVNQWVLCEATDSGPGSDGPGGDPSGGTPGEDPGSGPGGGVPGAGPGAGSGDDQGGDDEESGSDTLDQMAEILCTPAVGSQPDADPRLIYPAPDQVEAVVANIAPCVDDFCPFEIVFEVPELEDPTDPIDPGQDEPEELTEGIKEQLMCDKFKGLCEPNITLISKNDLVKDDDEIPEASDGDCDGVQEDLENMGEICKSGDVGNMEEDWSVCHTADSGGKIAMSCTHHNADANQRKGEHQFTFVEGIGRESESDMSAGERAVRKARAVNAAEDLTGSEECAAHDPIIDGGMSITYVNCD